MIEGYTNIKIGDYIKVNPDLSYSNEFLKITDEIYYSSLPHFVADEKFWEKKDIIEHKTTKEMKKEYPEYML